MLVRIILGLGVTVVGFGIAGRRFHWLSRLIRSGKPAPERTRGSILPKAEAEVTEVAGQRKLLQWTVPGLAHFFTMWGFWYHIAADHCGGLRGALPEDLPLSRHRPVGVGWLRRGLLRRTAVPVGPHRLHHHPPEERPGQKGAPIPLLRLSHRCGLGRAGHDQPGSSSPCSSTGRPRSIPADPARQFPYGWGRLFASHAIAHWLLLPSEATASTAIWPPCS